MNELFHVSLLLLSIIAIYPRLIALVPFDITPTLTFVIPCCLMMLLLYQTVRRKGFQWKIQRYNPITLAFSAFLVLSSFGLLNSVYRYNSFQSWNILLLGFITYLLTANHQLKTLYEHELETEYPQRKFRFTLIGVLVLVGAFEAIIGLYQYLFQFNQQLALLPQVQTELSPRVLSGIQFTLESHRVTGTFGNPNLFALLLAVCIPLAMGYLFHTCSLQKKILTTLAIALMGTSLLLSASRGGILATIIALVIFAVLIDKKKLLQMKVWFTAGLLGILVIFIACQYQSPAPQKNESITNRIKSGQSTTQERINYWSLSMNMIKDRPILGAGLGNFGTIYGQYKPVGVGETRYAHNTFIQTWVEGGIFQCIGFSILFLTALIWPLLRWRKLTRPDVQIQFVVFYAATAAFFTDSFVGFGFYWKDLFWIGCIVLGGLYSACQAEFVPEPGPWDIVWRRQPNTWFLIITPSLILIMAIYLLVWILPNFKAQVYFMQGRNRLHTGEIRSSIESFQKAIKNMPNQSEYQQHLGNTLVSLGDFAHGIPVLKKSVELNPQTAFLRADLAKAYELSGNLLQAEDNYKAACDLYPAKPEYHQLLSNFYHSVGDNWKADQEALKADQLRN